MTSALHAAELLLLSSLEQCALDNPPSDTAVCCKCRMDLVMKRLQRLDKEIAAVSAKAESVKNEWMSATDPQQSAKLEKFYENRMEVKKLLVDSRRGLEAKLPSTGEHSPQQACPHLERVTSGDII